jgi:hypothetical protein
MASRSTLPTVRAQLVSLLGARAGLAGVMVTPCYPGDTDRTEAVYLGEARGHDVIPVSRAGRAKRQEDYQVDVWISVTVAGPDGAVAETRAFALFGELEDALADDPTIGLGGAGFISATLADWDERLALDPLRSGWACIVRAAVDIKARLS